ADDVWAVGSQSDAAGSAGSTTGLVAHFDGTAWSTVKVATPAGTTFDAVAVAGPGDVWASGKQCIGNIVCIAVVWHLSAAGWQQGTMSGGGTEALALVAFAPDTVWSLGSRQIFNGAKSDHVEHWNGKTFTAEDTGLPTFTGTANPHGELGSATPIFAAAG